MDDGGWHALLDALLPGYWQGRKDGGFWEPCSMPCMISKAVALRTWHLVGVHSGTGVSKPP